MSKLNSFAGRDELTSPIQFLKSELEFFNLFTSKINLKKYFAFLCAGLALTCFILASSSISEATPFDLFNGFKNLMNLYSILNLAFIGFSLLVIVIPQFISITIKAKKMSPLFNELDFPYMNIMTTTVKVFLLPTPFIFLSLLISLFDINKTNSGLSFISIIYIFLVCFYYYFSLFFDFKKNIVDISLKKLSTTSVSAEEAQSLVNLVNSIRPILSFGYSSRSSSSNTNSDKTYSGGGGRSAGGGASDQW